MIWHSSAAAAAVVLLYVHELLKLMTDEYRLQYHHWSAVARAASDRPQSFGGGVRESVCLSDRVTHTFSIDD